MTVTVEMCCGGGRPLTYRVTMNGNEMIMVSTAVLKIYGKPFGTAKGTLSADGKTITIEDEYTSAAAGQQVGKQTETWSRK